MKEFLQRLALYIIAIAIIYSVFSFLTLEMSPLEWGWFGRAIFALLVITCLGIFGDDDNNNNNDFHYT